MRGKPLRAIATSSGPNQVRFMISDEITSDRPSADNRQAALIRQHFDEIAPLLQNAHSKDEARAIVEDALARFDASCESEVLRSFVRQHIGSFVDLAWNGR